MAARPLLIIDDEAAIADIIATTLADEGYVVETATSQQAALERLTTHGAEGFCLVISDSFAWPPADVFAWLDRVRGLTPAPLVLASAHPERVFTGWADRGCAGFLPKPFDLDMLTTLVRAV